MADHTEPRSVASQVPFADICVLLEKIAKTQGTDKKKKVLRTFVESWREAHKSLHGGGGDVNSFHPALRLLLPHLDKERPAYGMKEVVLAKYYIEILSIGKDSADGHKLLNYRAPKHAKQDDIADFASVAYFVLRHRCPEKGRFNIEEINHHLDSLAEDNLHKKRDKSKLTLQTLLCNTSAFEQKWLIRMIFRELKTGLSETSVLGLFHPDAMEYYNITNSLSQVCKKLPDPSVRLNEVEITLFSPFRPMLGQRGDINQVEKVMGDKPFFIETKIDGERMQMHKQGDSYKFFSRNANDYTHVFGCSSKEGFLTPHIARQFSSNVASCILDGEMIVFDTNDNVCITKAVNLDVKSPATYKNGLQPCFIVFDVLLVNDRKLANVPLKERISYMEKVFEPRTGFLELVKRKQATSREEVVLALNEAIDSREEGLLLKCPSAVYKPNVRTGSGWFKLKPEYVDSLSDEMDLLIVGGYFGVGNRSGMISHFLLGVAIPSGAPGEQPTVFHSFCRVGTGYTLNELRQLGERLRAHWLPFDTRKPPDCVVLAPGFKEKPDVWIEPSKSKVVQIKATEIVKSDKFKTGVTLRFPRLEKVRDDKSWYECLDLRELKKLSAVAQGKLTYQHLSLDHSGEPSRKKRRAGVRAEQPRTVAEHFRPADVSSVTEVSNMFEGKEFCVVNGPPHHTKAALEKKVVENGGTFTQTPTQETFCVVAERKNVRVRNIIGQGKFDVVHASWLVQCLESSRLLPWLPHHMLHTSPGTARHFSKLYDRHGDSYTEDATVSSLKDVFKSVADQNGAVSLSALDIARTELRYFPDDCPLGLLRCCRLYLDQCRTIGDQATAIPNCSLELCGLEARFFGAQVSQTFDASVTHVLFDERDLSRLPEFQRIMHDRTLKQHFVTSEWLSQSVETGRLLQERAFTPGRGTPPVPQDVSRRTTHPS